MHEWICDACSATWSFWDFLPGGRLARAAAAANAALTVLVLALVLWASTASAQSPPSRALSPDNVFRAGLVAGIAAAGMDLSITSGCLATRRCVEGNPVLRPLADHPLAFGAVRTGAVGLAFWEFTRLHEQGHPRLARGLAWSVAAGYVGVSVHNVRVLAKAR